MTTAELQKKLEEAYTLKNLNNISLTLINLYKEKQFTTLQKIAEIIGDFFEIEISSNGKGFSKLIKLYHPDKLSYYQNEISRLAQLDDLDGLLEFSHILKIERIDEISTSLNNYEDIDYSPVYEWDIEAEGFRIFQDKQKEKKVHTKPKGYNFYDAIKMRQFGNTDIEYPSYYLEDIEEFELSSSDINDLDGIQFCIHAKSIDLSENRIVDLLPIAGLGLIEELNLSYNEIEDIDPLSNLINLKRIILGNNKIKDITPLFELDKLEYVDLTGNKIPEKQINQFKELGISIDF